MLPNDPTLRAVQVKIVVTAKAHCMVNYVCPQHLYTVLWVDYANISAFSATKLALKFLNFFHVARMIIQICISFSKIICIIILKI